MSEKDIVADILARVEAAVMECLEKAGDIKQDTMDAVSAKIRALEKPVRRDYAGTEAYVAAREADFPARKAAAVTEASRTGRVAEAGSRHGIGRATMYRLLKTKQRR
jgi:hypothetical protein